MVVREFSVYGSDKTNMPDSYSFLNFKKMYNEIASAVLLKAKELAKSIDQGVYVIIEDREVGCKTFLKREDYNGSNT